MKNINQKSIYFYVLFIFSIHTTHAQVNSELNQNSLEFSENTTLKSTISWDGINGDLLIENKQPTFFGGIEGDIFIKSTDDIFINGALDGISMGIHNNGHVGIGESSTAIPPALLTVKQKNPTPDSNSGIRITNLPGTDSGRMWVDGSGNFTLQKGGNINQLSLNAVGNVGIGTTALSNVRLNINGRVRINGNTDGTAWTLWYNR